MNFIYHNIWDNPSHWLICFRGWNHQPDEYRLHGCCKAVLSCSCVRNSDLCVCRRIDRTHAWKSIARRAVSAYSASQKRPEHKFGRNTFKLFVGPTRSQKLFPRAEDVNISHKSLPESSAQSQICTHLDKVPLLKLEFCDMEIIWQNYDRAYARSLQHCSE